MRKIQLRDAKANLSAVVDGVVQVPHGMTVWKGQIWFSVAETGEVYRVPLPS